MVPKEITPQHTIPVDAIQAMCELGQKLAQYLQELPMLRGVIDRNITSLNNSSERLDLLTTKTEALITEVGGFIKFMDEIFPKLLQDHLEQMVMALKERS